MIAYTRQQLMLWCNQAPTEAEFWRRFWMTCLICGLRVRATARQVARMVETVEARR